MWRGWPIEIAFKCDRGLRKLFYIFVFCFILTQKCIQLRPECVSKGTWANEIVYSPISWKGGRVASRESHFNKLHVLVGFGPSTPTEKVTLFSSFLLVSLLHVGKAKLLPLFTIYCWPWSVLCSSQNTCVFKPFKLQWFTLLPWTSSPASWRSQVCRSSWAPVHKAAGQRVEEEPKAYPEVGAGLLREGEEVVEVRSQVEVEEVEVLEMQDKEEAEEVECLHLVVVEEVEVQFPPVVVVEQHQLLQVPPQPVKGLKSFRDKKRAS